MMCPDKELISAFYDDETDHRWSSEIKKHIKGCSICSGEYNKLDKISFYMSESGIPDEKLIKERMYESIQRRRNVIYQGSFWKKHIDVSLQVILSAAAVVIVLCAVLIVGLQQFSSPAVAEEIRNESAELNVQILSFEDAAAYLLSDDSGFDVLITIPASDAWSVSGEPQLIREADYKRGQ